MALNHLGYCSDQDMPSRLTKTDIESSKETIDRKPARSVSGSPKHCLKPLIGLLRLESSQGQLIHEADGKD